MCDRFLAVVVVCSVFGSVVVSAGVGSTATTDRVASSLQPDPSANLTVQTAPRSTFGPLETVSDSTQAATNDTKIATGDVLALRLSGPGLQEALTTNTASSETRLRELIQSDALDIQLRQTNENNANTLDLIATIENDGIKLIDGKSDDGAHVAYLLIDTRRMVFERGDVTPRGQFEATVTWSHDGNETTVSKRFEIVRRMATFNTQEEDTVVVEAASNQTVSGNTTVAPGTQLTIQARSEGQSSFVITKTTQVKQITRVTSNGTFSLGFDFGNVTRGVQFTLSIPNQGFENNATTDGVVRPPPTASVHISNQRLHTGTQTVIIRSVTLSEGGFVTIHDKSYLDDGTTPSQSLRGTSRYLEPGNYTNVTITLDEPYTNTGTAIVVPHLDTNGNEEFDFVTDDVDSPYLGVDSKPIVTSATVSVRQTDTRTTQSDDSGSPPPRATGTTSRRTTPGANQTAVVMSVPENTGTSTNKEGGDNTSEKKNEENASNSGSENTLDTDGSPPNELNTDTMRATEAQGPGFGFVVGLVALCVAALKRVTG